MLTQGTFGAVIQHIEPANVSTIPVPVFPEEMQKEIDQLIRDAASLRDKAAEFLIKLNIFYRNLLASLSIRPTGIEQHLYP